MKTKIYIFYQILILSIISPVHAANEQFFWSISTGGTGGTYYPLGQALAELLSTKATLEEKPIVATAEAGNASVANAELLRNAEIDSAFVQADIVDAAYYGRNQFTDKPVTNLRALGALYPETVQVILAGDAGVRQFTDLKGKNISSGSKGSGQWQLLGDLLATFKMTRKDVQEDYASFAQAVDKMKDGKLTAALITAGIPTASVVELASKKPIRILPLQGEGIDALLQKQPYYTKVTLPANTYSGQNQPIETLAVMALWVTHDSLPDELVYTVVKTLYENAPSMANAHIQGKQIDLNNALKSISIPLHPGAEKYYREKGLIK